MPVANLLGEEGGGFAIAQARLGPGRIHHCMRLIGMAERAIDLMVAARAVAGSRSAGRCAEQGVVREQIAQSRIEVEQARLLVLKTAWLIDSARAEGRGHRDRRDQGDRARGWPATVIDRAIQIHGGGGMSDDFPLAYFYAWARALRLADGPDEVHLRTVARQELGRHH